ncbi:MAG: hypothetical protein HND55_07360 [Pseudomonadota bacterium]|nr:MAG: hypothetical protein HND55_07360 [Pseudomonadota bacterium]
MNRTTLIALAAVFLTPVVLAVLLHSQWLEWEPAQTRNHGELLEPPPRLPKIEAPEQADRPGRDHLISVDWQLLHYRRNGCDQDCLESLYWLRQVRRAQNRHQPEIGLLLVTPVALDSSTRAQIEALSDPIAIIDGAAGRSLSSGLPVQSADVVSYIIDPRRHIILRYPADTDFNGMRRDLSRLLTWTRTDAQ